MSELPKPELDLQLSVNEPLVSSTTAEETNLLNVTIESVFSPPDAFQVTGQQFAYVASLPLPMNSEVYMTAKTYMSHWLYMSISLSKSNLKMFPNIH